MCIRELFPCILLYSKTRIHQRVPYIAFPEQAWDSGPNFISVPQFNVEMESVVPVFTGLAPTKVTPQISHVTVPLTKCLLIKFCTEINICHCVVDLPNHK